MKDASTYERSYGGRPEKYMKTVEKLVLFHNKEAKDASATPKDTTPAPAAKPGMFGCCAKPDEARARATTAGTDF